MGRPPAPRATPTWTTCPSWGATATTPAAWRRSTKEGRSLRSDPVGIMYPECITSPLSHPQSYQIIHPSPIHTYYVLYCTLRVMFVSYQDRCEMRRRKYNSTLCYK